MSTDFAVSLTCPQQVGNKSFFGKRHNTTESAESLTILKGQNPLGLHQFPSANFVTEYGLVTDFLIKGEAT